MRYWAYETLEGTDRASWNQRVLEESHRQNAALGHPLPAREVEGMATRVAGWVWARRINEETSHQCRGKTSASRRDGRASGMARRRGTPLEHDRTPWVRLGCSRATYYRKYRHVESGQVPSQRPRPWISLGITAAAFRQRVRRVRAGTYRGANQGVSPWESVGISEEEWLAHYGSSETVSPIGVVDDTDLNCHAFETKPVLGGERGGLVASAAGKPGAVRPDPVCEDPDGNGGIPERLWLVVAETVGRRAGPGGGPGHLGSRKIGG